MSVPASRYASRPYAYHECITSQQSLICYVDVWCAYTTCITGRYEESWTHAWITLKGQIVTAICVHRHDDASSDDDASSQNTELLILDDSQHTQLSSVHKKVK
jgi:hypothetical protein